jgi:hypothetical protein
VPSASEIREQVARESEWRSRLAVPAFAGGVLYLLSAISIEGTLRGAPTVGVLQGLEPALRGEANPVVSPRASEVKFVSHHAFGLLSGSALAALAVGALTLAVVSLGHQVVSAIETHKFAVGHDFSAHAVDQALTKGTLNMLVVYLALIAALALAAGTIVVAMNAQRVGLIPRWMGILGIFTGVLLFLPIGGAELQIVPAFWLVMMGILYMGKWSKGDPPAWAAGEARPWPSQARMRGASEPRDGPSKNGKGEISTPGADVAPAPAQPSSSRASRRRRRKRRARG